MASVNEQPPSILPSSTSNLESPFSEEQMLRDHLLCLAAHVGINPYSPRSRNGDEAISTGLMLVGIGTKLGIRDEMPMTFASIEVQKESLESIKKRISERKFSRVSPLRALPAYSSIPDDFDCQPAIKEIWRIGRKTFELVTLHSSPDFSQLKAMLFGALGYMLPDYHETNQKLSLFALQSVLLLESDCSELVEVKQLSRKCFVHRAQWEDRNRESSFEIDRIDRL